MKNCKVYGKEKVLRTYSEVSRKFLLNQVSEGYDLAFPRYKVLENRRIIHTSMDRNESDRFFCSVIYDRIMQLNLC